MSTEFADPVLFRLFKHAFGEDYQSRVVKASILLLPRNRIDDEIAPYDPATLAFLRAAAQVSQSSMPNVLLAKHSIQSTPGRVGEAEALAYLDVPKVAADRDAKGAMLKARILSGGVRGTAGLKQAFEFYRTDYNASLSSAPDQKAIAALYMARDAIAGGDAPTLVRVMALAASRAEPDIAQQARTEITSLIQSLNGGKAVPTLNSGEKWVTRNPFSITSDDYPAAALRAEQQGRVSVRLLVDPAGLPLIAEIVQSSGSPYLDDYTARLVMRRTAPGFTLPPERVGHYVWLAMPTVAWSIPN